MALVKCPECEEGISDTASKCPKCGVVLREASRSVFGKLVKFGFIGFNALMLWWLVDASIATTELTESLTSDSERTGAAIGTGIGMLMIFFIWGFGDIVLGVFMLMTRPKD